MRLICSKDNPNYKLWLKLINKSNDRKRLNLFIIEGKRELLRAIDNKIEIIQIILSESASKNVELSGTFSKIIEKIETFQISDNLFKTLSYRENPDGICGIAKTFRRNFDFLNIKSNGLYLLLEHLENPGNIGALLRSAEATAVDAVFIADQQIDIFNPNIIRNSQGALFGLNIFHETSEFLFEILNKSNLQLFATTPNTNNVYWDNNFIKGSVFCIGNEANGLSKLWLNSAKKILIPMYGNTADSLNASVAGALCLYEAKRQRC